MNKIQDYLLQLSDAMDSSGKMVCADAIELLIKNASVQKLAQYVGAIGYVLKQNRAMCNCVRRKKSDTKSAQEIVLECLKEYQDGQNYNDTEWSKKYAQVIQSEPLLFETGHLHLLSSIYSDNRISEHFDLVKKSMHTLNINGEKDNFLSGLLDNFEQLNSILAKEGSNSESFFKLADRPERGSWSRFWNPSQVGKNPFSWFSNKREKGNDEDAKFEMAEIIKNIENIKYSGQRLKSNISRIKNETINTNQQPGLASIVSTINKLDNNDWNKTSSTLSSLKNMMLDGQLGNLPQIRKLKEMVHDASSSAAGVRDSINTLQQLMRDLRTRTAIMGRDSGRTNSGGMNPNALASPAEDYAAFDRVMNQMYNNPLDSKAIWYAEKMHSRLDDRLRYITHNQDNDINEWLKGKETQENPQQPAAGNQPAVPSQNQSAPSQPITPQFNMQAVNDAISSFNRIATTPEDRQKLTQFLTGLTPMLLSVFGNSNGGNQAVQQLVSKLLDGINNASANKQPAVPQNTPAASPPTATPQPAAGSAQAPNVFPPPTAQKSNLPPRVSNMTISDLVKFADVLDKVDSRIADILDDIIKNHKKNSIGIDIFPEFGFPIKEEIISVSENN